MDALLVPFRCLSSAMRRQVQVQMLHSKSVSKCTYGVIKAGNIQSVVDLDTELFTAYLRWGDVHACLEKLGSYLENSKWTHWKIRVNPLVAWPPAHSPQQILPYVWAFFYPMYRVVALVHQDPFPFPYPYSYPSSMFPMRLFRCALRICDDLGNIQWQQTRLHIQPVHTLPRASDAQNQNKNQNVSVTFYPPIVVWGSHMNDDVQLCIEDWLPRAPCVMTMRHFSHILYSYAREPMYVRQYYTPDLLETHTNTACSTNTEIQAFFLRKVYINLDMSFQRIVPALHRDDWWSFRNAILSILCSSHHAACVLQRAWRQCIANPSYRLCRQRLNRECHSEKIEAFKE